MVASVLARFSTLEGYASRNRRNGIGSELVDDRSPSRFSSGSGTKADAKQQPGLPCVYAAELALACERARRICARLNGGLGLQVLG